MVEATMLNLSLPRIGDGSFSPPILETSHNFIGTGWSKDERMRASFSFLSSGIRQVRLSGGCFVLRPLGLTGLPVSIICPTFEVQWENGVGRCTGTTKPAALPRPP